MRLTPTLRNWLMAPIAIALVSIFVAAPASGTNPVPGSQGVDTAIPLTDSKSTVPGRGRFASMNFTVNQTRNLTFQTVSVTWTGGVPTQGGQGTQYGTDFVQIMQCWGDDDRTVPSNPGPPPENCVFGAGRGGATGGLPANLAATRELGTTLWTGFDPAGGFVDTRNTKVWVPFQAVDGTKIDVQVNPAFNPNSPSGDFWLNPYFNDVSTNEIPGGRTLPDGKGAELFQVNTGLESSGLGCALRRTAADGTVLDPPKCWIVVVPRSRVIEENVNTPFSDPTSGVSTSPLSPAAWRNRIAFPLEFNPLDSPCSINADDRRIAGSELSLKAIANWQPTLCETGDLPPFSYAPVPESLARQSITNPVAGAPGMVVTARPAVSTASRPIVFAPISISGLVVGFNVERIPAADGPIESLSGVRVAEINLTPRLVAKLLTQSYATAVTLVQPPDYLWLGANPGNLDEDPDFLRFNPEFELLNVFNDRTFSSLQLPAGTSDAARQVWEWVLADAEAARWLSGQPDEWGMAVNPVYSTSPTVNPSGFGFGQPAPSSFPKSDPYCYTPPTRNQVPGIPICGTDWVPYARSFDEAAVRTRLAFDGARVDENLVPLNNADVWKRVPPQLNGRRTIISLTDTASASLYGLQVARLSRAGDNADDRAFIAPDEASLLAGVASMSPIDEPQVKEPDPMAQPPGAYPLSALTYAAVSPRALDQSAREDYAAFLEYAAGPGQEPGLALGQLPRGYVSLPADLRAQTLTAAQNLASFQEPPAPPSAAAPPAASPSVTSPPATVPLSDTQQTPNTATPEPMSAPSPVRTQARSSSSQAPGQSGVPSDVGAVVDATDSTNAAVENTQPAEQTVATESLGGGPAIATPKSSTGATRMAVPVLGSAALVSALMALEVTKRPRRRSGTSALAALDTSGSRN